MTSDRDSPERCNNKSHLVIGHIPETSQQCRPIMAKVEAYLARLKGKVLQRKLERQRERLREPLIDKYYDRKYYSESRESKRE